MEQVQKWERISEKRIGKICDDFSDTIESDILEEVRRGITSFLLEPVTSSLERAMKARLREYIVRLAQKTKDSEFEKEVTKVLYRPMDEMYIPIPDSAQFHKIIQTFW